VTICDSNRGLLLCRVPLPLSTGDVHRLLAVLLLLGFVPTSLETKQRPGATSAIRCLDPRLTLNSLNKRAQLG
jgi:hypothetical protein